MSAFNQHSGSKIASAGATGDNGPATSALLNSNNYALGITVDGTGNVYIADYGNSKVRKVSTAGIITTVSGKRQILYILIFSYIFSFFFFFLFFRG